jgi:rare lipoprotein A
VIRPIPACLRAAAAAVLACALTPSATALADDGGAGFGAPTAAVPPAQATPATGDGGTLLVTPDAMLGRSLHVKGTMADGRSGRRVTVERQRKDGSWVAAATATTTSGGAFDAVWRANHIGRFPLRAVPAPAAGVRAASTPSTGITPVTVYRQATATFFGPGFFGRQTACGQTLTPSTLGVAHRTLPCGTLVAVYYKGRSVTVPVIDRGPFREGTSWDLTQAAADALQFTGAGKIGALRLPKGSVAPAGA